METSLDSSVLLDLFTEDPRWLSWSQAQLTLAAQRGAIVLNAVVLAEIAPRFPRIEHLRSALPSMAIVEEIPLAAAFLAGHAHADYRRAGGARQAVLPDCLIGAHAAVTGRPLLTRDPRRLAARIPGTALITPENPTLDPRGVSRYRPVTAYATASAISFHSMISPKGKAAEPLSAPILKAMAARNWPEWVEGLRRCKRRDCIVQAEIAAPRVVRRAFQRAGTATQARREPVARPERIQMYGGREILNAELVAGRVCATGHAYRSGREPTEHQTHLLIVRRSQAKRLVVGARLSGGSRSWPGGVLARPVKGRHLT